MRIGYESMLTSAQDTGVGVAIRELLQALARLSPQDEFLAFSRPKAGKRLAGRTNLRYIQSRSAGLCRLGRIAWQQAALPFLLRRLPVDVYHAPGYVVSSHLPVPTVVTVYDTIALERPELASAANALHYRWAVPRAVRHASRVIVPCHYVKERLTIAVPISASRIRVIPLGVSGRFGPLNREEARKRLDAVEGLNGQEFFLCVGNIERKKNFATAVKAFAKWRSQQEVPRRLVIAGKPGNDFQHIKTLVRKEHVGSQVIMTGYVDEETLIALYSAASALLYPSLEEGFGLPPLEAMACGTPVISSNAGALPETVGNAAILAPPENTLAWVDAINALIASTDQRRNEIQARGLAHAAQFTWERTATAVLDVYRDVVENHARAKRTAREALS